MRVPLLRLVCGLAAPLLLGLAAAGAEPAPVPAPGPPAVSPIGVPAGPISVAVGDDYELSIAAAEGVEFTAARAFSPADCLWFAGERTPTEKLYLVRPKKAGEFRVIVWARNAPPGAYQTITIVGVPKAGGTQPIDPVRPVDPVKPIPAKGLYFLIVRPDGPASPDFTRAMSLPGWAKLAAAGHRFKDKSVAEAASLGVALPAGTALPCVVTLRVTGDRSEVARPAVPLPATTDAVERLPEGVQ